MYAPRFALSLYTDFENFSVFKPAALHDASLKAMLDQLLAWSGAMKGMRTSRGCTGSSAPPYFTAQILAAASLLLKPSGSRKLTCTRSPAFSLDRS